jgi:hypothetical protein
MRPSPAALHSCTIWAAPLSRTASGKARGAHRERTVAHHVEHILTKTGVSTRGAARLYAVQHGLLT